jgi:hypothetical protein
MFTPTQLKIAFGGLAVMGLLAVYVPWTYTVHVNTIHRETPAGYHLLFEPPAPAEDRYKAATSVRVNWTQALVPMAVVALATAVGVAAARPRPTAVRTPADETEVPAAQTDGVGLQNHRG